MSLMPSGRILRSLAERAAVLTSTNASNQVDSEPFMVTFAAEVGQWFSPHPADAAYYDDLVVVGTPRGVGAAFCPHRGASRSIGATLGLDSRTPPLGHLCVEVATLDAAFGSVEPAVPPKVEMTGTGTSEERGDLRGTLIANELSRLGIESVVMVGAVGSVLKELSSRGMQVSAVDMDPAVVGKKLGGVQVMPSTHTAGLLAHSDAALVTGMTLTTETLEGLMDSALRSATKVVMFCQTGSNFAPDLLELGVSVVIAERFPFYMVPGSTDFRVFRQD